MGYFSFGQQKKSDPDRGSGSERPLRKRHAGDNAQLSRYRQAPAPHPNLLPKERRSHRHTYSPTGLTLRRSMRAPSMAMTSKCSPSLVKLSPTLGKRPNCCST